MDVKQEYNPLAGLASHRSMAESAEQAMIPLATPRQPTLQPQADGSIRLGRFRLTKTGLMAEGYVTETDWKSVYEQIAQIRASLAWIVGDWATLGELTWHKSYEQLAAITGLKVETLREYAYVARNVDSNLRLDVLSFTHHRLVAGLRADEQRLWLGWAATAGKDGGPASLAAFRRELAARGLAELPPGVGAVARFEQRLFALYERNWKRPTAERREMALRLRQLADALEQPDQRDRLAAAEQVRLERGSEG